MRNYCFQVLLLRVGAQATSLNSHFPTLGARLFTQFTVLALLTALTTNVVNAATNSFEDTTPTNLAPITERNIDVSRKSSNKHPRGVQDQAIVNGWPLYRTRRGQQAFNHAMATLKATDSPAPGKNFFKGCANLACNITLPKISRDGWLRAGRIWISPNQYVLIVHSPRRSRKKKVRRNSPRRMKYFIFHEFQNSTHNTDPYDTISAHKFSVFVSFYMGKQMRDVKGNRFVVVVQVAPYDARSIHASNKNSAGPGIEVAKNTAGRLEPLQGAAGILIATMVKNAAPRLKVVNHRGYEGRPMLRAYQKRLKNLKKRPNAPHLTLPFTPANEAQVASVKIAGLGDLIKRPGLMPSQTRLASAPVARPRTAKSSTNAQSLKNQAKRPVKKFEPSTLVASKPKMAAPKNTSTPATPVAFTMSPLAKYLKANLSAMKQVPHFASFIPVEVSAILEDGHEPGVVYLLDKGNGVLGKIHARQQNGVVVKGSYVYVPVALAKNSLKTRETGFKLEIEEQKFDQIAALVSAHSANEPQPTLMAPPTLATRPLSPPEPMLLHPPKLASSPNNHIGG